MKRKLLDVSIIKSLGWKPKISMDEGFRETIACSEKTNLNNE